MNAPLHLVPSYNEDRELDAFLAVNRAPKDELLEKLKNEITLAVEAVKEREGNFLENLLQELKDKKAVSPNLPLENFRNMVRDDAGKSNFATILATRLQLGNYLR